MANATHTSLRDSKETIMKTIETIMQNVGRCVVGLGSALALVSAVVITSNGPALGNAQAARPVEVVRLDPVVVTISTERFAAIRAEEKSHTMLARVRALKTKLVG